MTVASLLGPDKRHIKASSDIHLCFFIVLSYFFSRKNAVSLTPKHRTEQPQQFSYHDLYSYVVRWAEPWA